MRWLLLVALVVLACGTTQAESRALAPAPAPPSASATPLPSGVVDPQPLIDRDTRLSAIVLRVDKVTAKLTTMRDLNASAGAPLIADTALVWAVAIVGRIHVDAIIDLPDAPCAVFGHDAMTGDIRSVQKGGSLAFCQPYFAESLTPLATPIHVCGTVTAYFVSDIASGGRIEIDGKNYPIASSASHARSAPLPMVGIGERICLDGTVSASGDILDFTITRYSSESSSASPTSPARSTTGPPSPSSSEAPWLAALLLSLVIVVLASAVAASRHLRLGPYR